MKFTVEQAALNRALAAVSGIVPAKPVIPITGNVLIVAADGELAVTGIDLETELTCCVPADIEKAGSATIPAKAAYDLVRLLPAGAMVSVGMASDGRVEMKSGRSRAVLATLPPDQFPRLTPPADAARISIRSQALSTALSTVSHAQSTDEGRIMLNGVFIHMPSPGQRVLRAVASNGLCLACCSAEFDAVEGSFSGAILSTAVVNQLERALPDDDSEVTLRISDRSIEAKVGSTTIVAKLVDATFPDYPRLIPSEPRRTVIADRGSLSITLKRVGVMAGDKHHSVKLHVASDSMTLSTRDRDAGEITDVVEAEGDDGAPFEAQFNRKLLGDALTALRGDTATLDFDPTNRGPLKIQPQGASDRLFLVMPVN